MRAREWQRARSPKQGRLTGVESNGDAVFASGNRGLLIERQSRGNWTAAIDEGPQGNGRNLNDISITDDGERVWYCGDSGALGYYDRGAEKVVSHYAPGDYTSGFVTVEVSGRAGSEHVFFANNSGSTFQVRADGETAELVHNTTPSNASRSTEVVEYRGEHYMSTVGGDVFSTEGSGSWQQLSIAEEPIVALATADTGVAAITESGTLYRDVSSTDGAEPRKIELDVRGMEELTVRGKTFVAVGRDGRIAQLDASGGATYPDPAPGVSFYGADVLEDDTIVVAGSSGTILEGTL